MASINKVILVGNVGKDPECGVAPNSGNAYANFSVATSEKWTDKASGEKKEKTEWHRIVVWGPLAENVVKPYVKKGSRLYIEGKQVTRKYQAQDGTDRYVTEVALQGFQAQLVLLSGKGSDDRPPIEEPEGPGMGAGSGIKSPAEKAAANGELGFDKKVDDEIPF